MPRRDPINPKPYTRNPKPPEETLRRAAVLFWITPARLAILQPCRGQVWLGSSKAGLYKGTAGRSALKRVLGLDF